MSFVLHGPAGFCNAVRRALCSDLTSWAPKSLTVRTNTSSMSDEDVAHRIGLIPFQKVGNGDTLTIRGCGPLTLTSGDFLGPAFAAVSRDVAIVELCPGQVFDADVTMDEQPASKHARYSKVAAVGMSKVGADMYKLTFETLGEDAKRALFEALAALEQRVDAAMLELGNQPSEPPRSYC